MVVIAANMPLSVHHHRPHPRPTTPAAPTHPIAELNHACDADPAAAHREHLHFLDELAGFEFIGQCLLDSHPQELSTPAAGDPRLSGLRNRTGGS